MPNLRLEEHPVECQFLSIYVLSSLSEKRSAIVQRIAMSQCDDEATREQIANCKSFAMEITEEKKRWQHGFLDVNDKNLNEDECLTLLREMCKTVIRRFNNWADTKKVNQKEFMDPMSFSAKTFLDMKYGRNLSFFEIRRLCAIQTDSAFSYGIRRFWENILLYPQFSSQASAPMPGSVEANALRLIYVQLAEEESAKIRRLGDKYEIYKMYLNILQKYKDSMRENADAQGATESDNKDPNALYGFIKEHKGIRKITDIQMELGYETVWEDRRANWKSYLEDIDTKFYNKPKVILNRDDLINIAKYCGMNCADCLHLLAIAGYGVREKSVGNALVQTFNT